MTTFAQDRAAFESFLDCVQGGAGKDVIAGYLAENVVLIGPLSDEPLTGREAVAEVLQTVYTLAADLTYEEVQRRDPPRRILPAADRRHRGQRNGLRLARRGRQDRRGNHIGARCRPPSRCRGTLRWTGILTLRETATASRQPEAAGQRR